MKRQTSVVFAGYLMLTLLLFPAILFAAPYYQGKVIKIIVGLIRDRGMIVGLGSSQNTSTSIFLGHLPLLSRTCPGRVV